jgi:hypothetical protein
MDNLNPNTDDLPKLIRSLDQRLENIEKSRQIYQGDWVDLNTGIINRSNTVNNRFVVVGNFNMRRFFSAGRKIRFRKNNSLAWHYGIAFRIRDNTFDVFGSTITPSETLNAISYATNETPSGFPQEFSYTTTEVSGFATITDQDCYCSVVGNQVTVSNKIEFNCNTTTAFISFALPFGVVPDISNKYVNAIYGEAYNISDGYNMSLVMASPPITINENEVIYCPGDIFDFVILWDGGKSYLTYATYTYFLK